MAAEVDRHIGVGGIGVGVVVVTAGLWWPV